MYFHITTAKAPRICEVKDKLAWECLWPGQPGFNDRKAITRSIMPGERILCFDNGTHGPGARSKNYSNAEAIKLLERMILELRNPEVPTAVHGCVVDKEAEYAFASDDIPF